MISHVPGCAVHVVPAVRRKPVAVEALQGLLLYFHTRKPFFFFTQMLHWMLSPQSLSLLGLDQRSTPILHPNWTAIVSPSPFIPGYTSNVSTTRGSEKLGQPFSTTSCNDKGKLSSCAVTSNCNMTPRHLFSIPMLNQLNTDKSGYCPCVPLRWCSPVVVFETVDLIFSVYGEGHSIKALITDDTAETARVVWLSEGLQDLERK